MLMLFMGSGHGTIPSDLLDGLPECRREWHVIKGKGQVLGVTISAWPHRCPSGNLWQHDHSIIVVLPHLNCPKEILREESIYMKQA